MNTSLSCALLGVALLLSIGSPLLAHGAGVTTFAVIGDYGEAGNKAHANVAAMVKSWNPDFIVTTGDNSYSDFNIDQNSFQVDVVAYYGTFIRSKIEDPKGLQTRFFPSIGNHDYGRTGHNVFPPRIEGYEQTFATPPVPKKSDKCQYYEFSRGPVRFFVLDSNINSECDARDLSSAQHKWFEDALDRSAEPWNIVVFHHAPYNTGAEHSSEQHMRSWNFEGKKKISAVLAGHEHVYERPQKENLNFFTVGISGRKLYGWAFPDNAMPAESKKRYPTKEHSKTPVAKVNGAMLVIATASKIEFVTVNLNADLIDRIVLAKENTVVPSESLDDPTPATGVDSICYGDVNTGRLKNGVVLPMSGKNFEPYSMAGIKLGRTYVHSKIRPIVSEAYENLLKNKPDARLVYGESGLATGGDFKPHVTHENGLSVDFMVPVRDSSGHSVRLPSEGTFFGYEIYFDADTASAVVNGNKLDIDFEVIAAHLLALHDAAIKRNVSIAQVYFDGPFIEKLKKTPLGGELTESKFHFKANGKPRHDEHYHVDFAVP